MKGKTALSMVYRVAASVLPKMAAAGICTVGDSFARYGAAL